jgi:hypothetical protein
VYTATLNCGTVLTYEARSLLPSDGELVPCRRHGYCPVTGSDRRAGGGAGRCDRRARPRTEQELVEWLHHHQVTSVHALRRQRFTLRMLTSVQADVGLEVDHTTGRVLVRASQALPRDPTRPSPHR